MMQQCRGVPPDSQLSVSFIALSEWIVGSSACGVTDSSPKFGAEPSSSFTTIAFRQSASGAAWRVSDWHRNCFEKVRKEHGNENQDEFESRTESPTSAAVQNVPLAEVFRISRWVMKRASLFKTLVASGGGGGAEAMKAKTKVKAGAPTLPLPPPRRF